MGIIEAVGKICPRCGQAYSLTPDEIRKALKRQQREPCLCQHCRNERR